jgi:lipoprotein-releasing system permease protein
MRADIHIARRYFTQKRELGFITLISWFSIIGLALGVASLVVTLAILDGFESELRQRIIGFESHVKLETFDNIGFARWDTVSKELENWPEVAGISPLIEKEALLKVGRIAEGVILRGVVESRMEDVFDVSRYIIEGDFRLAATETETGEGLVVGRDLFDRLKLEIGQRVFALDHRLDTGQMVQPRVKPFVVTGVYETGFHEYDDTFAFVSLNGAQQLFDMEGRVSALGIRLKDVTRGAEIVDILNTEMAYPFYASTWFDMHNIIFSWLRTQRLPMLLIFGIIIIVGVFNLGSSLIMIVLTKRRDIGILKAMGAGKAMIQRIFLLEGLCVGIIGVLMGSLLGYGLCWTQEHYRILSLDKGVYFLNFVPVSLNPWNFAVIGLAALAVCVLATMIPARRAACMDPVDAIRMD